MHELLLCRCCSTGAFLGLGPHGRTTMSARRALLFVVGILCTKPKTRAFVPERTWAYQTKSAFSDGLIISEFGLICNEYQSRNRLLLGRQCIFPYGPPKKPVPAIYPAASICPCRRHMPFYSLLEEIWIDSVSCIEFLFYLF